jgi:hypothetical protein
VDEKALLQAIAELQARIDRLEGQVAEARMKYLEALDKTISRFQGRLARKLREEASQDAAGDAIPEYPSLHYPPSVSARRTNLRGW